MDAVPSCANCADEKPSARIVVCTRMKSTSVCNFCTDTFFIRTEIAAGARSAQAFLLHATTLDAP